MFDRRSGFRSDGREKRKEDVMLPEMGAWRAVILLYTTIIIEAQKIKKINAFHDVCLLCCGRELAVVVLRHYLLLLRVSCPTPCHCMLSDNVITRRMEYKKRKLPVCTLEY